MAETSAWQGGSRLDIREATLSALKAGGVELLDNPGRLLAYLLDLMDLDSPELHVIERNCDRVLLGYYAAAAKRAEEAAIRQAIASAEWELQHERLIDAGVARRVAEGIGEALGEYLGLTRDDEPQVAVGESGARDVAVRDDVPRQPVVQSAAQPTTRQVQAAHAAPNPHAPTQVAAPAAPQAVPLQTSAPAQQAWHPQTAPVQQAVPAQSKRGGRLPLVLIGVVFVFAVVAAVLAGIRDRSGASSGGPAPGNSQEHSSLPVDSTSSEPSASEEAEAAAEESEASSVREEESTQGDAEAAESAGTTPSEFAEAQEREQAEASGELPEEEAQVDEEAEPIVEVDPAINEGNSPLETAGLLVGAYYGDWRLCDELYENLGIERPQYREQLASAVSGKTLGQRLKVLQEETNRFPIFEGLDGDGDEPLYVREGVSFDDGLAQEPSHMSASYGEKGRDITVEVTYPFIHDSGTVVSEFTDTWVLEFSDDFDNPQVVGFSFDTDAA